MTQMDFIKICKDRKFWKAINNNSFGCYSRIHDKELFLKELYKKIAQRTYYPKPAQEYVTLNKGHGVIRIIPVLNLEDLCVYYYCSRKLEKYIALNRVPGTFGGYGLSGKLRQIEEGEISNQKDQFEIIEFDDESYVFVENGEYGKEISSMNSKAWFAELNDFTKKLYFTITTEDFPFIGELDISNFYDSIQLDNLEYKLRQDVPHSANNIVYLLMHFLRFWNRHVNFYRQQGSGIPQDALGECSRILANFYLQYYDKAIYDFCLSIDARYFRYADDQIFFAKSKKDLEKIIAKASRLLMKEGLNFNQKKVKLMSDKDFKKYYAFKNFFDLAYKKGELISVKAIERQIAYYFRNKKKLKKNGLSLLKRILTVLTTIKQKPDSFLRLKKYLIKELIVENYRLSASDLDRIYKILNSTEKKAFIRRLNKDAKECLYTDYLFALKSFYKSSQLRFGLVSKRITELKKFYQF